MTLGEAFLLLRVDPKPALKDALSKPSLAEQIATLEAFAGRVKRQYKICLGKSHPDRGGDAAKFKAIQAAYSLIETEHAKFLVRLSADFERREAERASRRHIILK